jgi:hypothetical protein
MGIESTGSVLPLSIVDDAGEVVEETICDSISGGKDKLGGMPRRLSLMRFKRGVCARRHPAKLRWKRS